MKATGAFILGQPTSLKMKLVTLNYGLDVASKSTEIKIPTDIL